MAAFPLVSTVSWLFWIKRLWFPSIRHAFKSPHNRSGTARRKVWNWPFPMAIQKGQNNVSNRFINYLYIQSHSAAELPVIKCPIYMHWNNSKGEKKNDPNKWHGCSASLWLLPVAWLALPLLRISALTNCWAVLIMYIIRLGSTYFMPKEWCVFNDSNTLPSLRNPIDRVLVSLTTINQHQGLSRWRKID